MTKPKNPLSISALWSFLILGSAPAETPESSTSPDESESAQQQENSSPAEEPQMLEAYQVIGTQDLAFSLPGSAYVLDEGDIQNLNYENINQVLRQIPGVYVREEDGYGNFPNISIRGVDASRSAKVTLMEDGVLTAPAPYSAPSAYYSPAVGRMAGIEVLKGSSQVRYGPETTGGVLNYIATPIPAGKDEGYARLSYGNNQDLQSHIWGGGTYDLEAGQLGVLGEFYSRSTDGFREMDTTAAYNGTNDTGFERIDGRVKLSFVPNWEKYNKLEFKLGYTDFDANETYLGISTQDFRADPMRRYAASRNDQINTYSTQTYLRHTVDLEENWRLVTTGYYQEFQRNWYKLNDLVDPDASLSQSLFDGTPGYNVLTGQAAGQLRYRANNRNYGLYGIQSDLNGLFETGDFDHHISTGLRLHHDYEDRFQHQDVYTQNDLGAFTSVDRGAPGSQTNRKSSADAIAYYLQDRIEYGDWAVIPGVRYEYIDYEVNNRASGSTESANLDVFTPGIGLEYLLDPDWMLFTGYYRGFSPPGPSGAVNGIKEETSDSFELGTRYRNDQGFRVELVGFYTFFNDLLVAESIGSGNLDDENVGNAISRGIEALVGIDPAQMTGQSFRSPITLAATYTDATLDGNASSADAESIFAGGKDGNRMPYIPEWQINLTGGLEFDRIRGYASVSFATSTYASANNSSAEVNPATGEADARFGKVDSYTTVDLSAYYRLWGEVELFAYAQNVFNDEYIISRLPHGPRPGTPATYGIGLQARW
ncbi:TonB-dependent receptor family protein [Puniceicoccus vermicola]|uniref:TonB-dependent receptor n=1 Tax=Puniceicoccus vermicola TaxID=388746 RepID=A0A7X1AUJ1_9BACT|nr:TonB-dependent receptor [Puniceicoccus vermicola]MBC2600192.1 TonB-dependent receptor [Puniceicoccus vermicola]